MPGILSPLSASGAGTIAGMKRPYEDVSVPTYGQPHPKKRKVVHELRHRQPNAHLVEPIGGGFGAAGDQEFIDTQLRRAIAIQCKGIGFASATPEAVESMAGLVHQYMTNFTNQIRKSMSSARRTVPLPHDYIYALASVGLRGSGALEPHLDTGDLPPSLLQPDVGVPEAPEEPPPNLDGMLGPELSGKADKESRKYIPAHFPSFPPKHTWMSTPVYAKREVDPHAIRERAAKEGIEAEKSLRKLMEKKKEGVRKLRASRAQPKRSHVAIKREALYRAALREALEDEDEDVAEKLRQARSRDAIGEGSDRDVQLVERARNAADEEAVVEQKEFEAVENEWNEAEQRGEIRRPTREEWTRQRKERLKEQSLEQRMEQRVTVNYGRKFWRQNARDH